jgi:hypothetical protein
MAAACFACAAQDRDGPIGHFLHPPPSDERIIWPRPCRASESILARQTDLAAGGVLTDAAKGKIYLAVLPSYADSGNDQADYGALRDAAEAHARRLESEAGGSSGRGV